MLNVVMSTVTVTAKTFGLGRNNDHERVVL